MGKHDIKYHNDMNLVSIGALNSSQIDILFSIGLTMAKDCSNKVIISFNEIKELANYSNKNIKNFYRDLEGLFKKLLDLDFRIETETNIKRMNLFQYYDIQKDNGVVEIKANEIFLKLFDNMLRGNFTLFDLKDLVSLKSGYSKLMFKLLKGWNGKKKVDYTLEELYYLLGVPLSVQTTANFSNKVMKPIKEELPKYFNKLEIEPIKTGRKITGYSFIWKPRASDVELIEDNIIHISEKLNRAIEKAKQNRFIKPLLTEKNVVKLIDIFTEDQLIKGLNHSYNEVKTEIKSLSYLVKAIETGAGKLDTKLAVKENNPKELTETIEVVEVIGEGKEEKIEVKELIYTKDFEGAKQFLYSKSYVIKNQSNMNSNAFLTMMNNLKGLDDAINFGEKFKVDMSYFKDEEVVEYREKSIKENPKDEVVEIKKKREMTQSQYDCLFEMYLSNIKLTMARENREIDIEEEKRKFDLKNKDTITIVKAKEITREELLNKFKELNFNYSLEELENAFELIEVIHTNQELLNVISSTNKELLDSIVENMREFKKGF